MIVTPTCSRRYICCQRVSALQAAIQAVPHRSLRDSIRLFLRRAVSPAGEGPDLPDDRGQTRALLTVPEACAALRISRWKLYGLIRARELRTVRIGRRRLVPTAAVKDLVARLAAEEDV